MDQNASDKQYVVPRRDPVGGNLETILTGAPDQEVLTGSKERVRKSPTYCVQKTNTLLMRSGVENDVQLGGSTWIENYHSARR